MATARERFDAVVIAMVATAVALPAHAAAPDPSAPDRVLVVPFEVQGTLPSDVRTRLGEALVAGLGEHASLAEGTTTTCSDAACWRALAVQLGATHVVHGTIAVDDRDYTVTAELIGADRGEVLSTSSRRCEICGYDEVGETVSDVAVLLRRKLDAGAATLPVLGVTSTPSGALVTVDGERVGKTPLELKIAAGAHDVQVSHEGYVATLERVVMVEGVREQVAATLKPVPARDRPHRARAMRIGGAAATAVGIAGVGVGVGLAVLDETPIRSRCSGNDKDIEGHCKYRYDSLAAGITIAVVGAAALATGIALLVVDHRRTRARRVALRPGPYGLALSF